MGKVVFPNNLVLDVPDSLYPPGEDSDLMVGVLQDRAELDNTNVLVEVGTGTGYVLLSYLCEIEGQRPRSVLSDINRVATETARDNAQQLGIDVDVVRMDLLSALRTAENITVAFNAPYLPFDEEYDRYIPPHELQALVGGNKGIEVSSRFVHDFARLEQGIAFLVVSSHAELAELEATIKVLGLRCSTVGKIHRMFEDIQIWMIET